MALSLRNILFNNDYMGSWSRFGGARHLLTIYEDTLWEAERSPDCLTISLLINIFSVGGGCGKQSGYGQALINDT